MRVELEVGKAVVAWVVEVACTWAFVACIEEPLVEVVCTEAWACIEAWVEVEVACKLASWVEVACKRASWVVVACKKAWVCIEALVVEASSWVEEVVYKLASWVVEVVWVWVCTGVVSWVEVLEE
jgi:hypothetical protein